MRPRRYIALAGLVLWLGANLSAAGAQSDEYVSGEITRIDESAGKIIIKHGPIKKFDMDASMTMAFRAGDPAMLKAVKPGDRVRFIPDRVDGQFTVTKIEKVK
jgi:Cu/Ag efflux protein CusF